MGLFLVICGIVYSLLVLTLIYSGTKQTPSSTPDTVLILGAQVKGSNKEHAYPSTSLKERLDSAIPYLNKYKETKVIVCGGKGADEPDSEANVMANYLIENGIASDRIIKEDTSTRTKENIQNALKKGNLGNTVIVTSNFHTYRALLLAKRLGIKEVSGLPATAQTKTDTKFRSYTREIMALAYAIIFDW